MNVKRIDGKYIETDEMKKYKQGCYKKNPWLEKFGTQKFWNLVVVWNKNKLEQAEKDG